MIAATGPTPLWYASRSSGYVSLLLLTAILAVGIATTVRWSNSKWPRFATQALHRNLSLLALVFLAVHIAAAVVDPFAGISALNAAAPFTGTYRPVWLGLGVVSVELMIALVVTSLLRRHIGLRAWRLVHWLAYACWPAAVLHTLGTGSDVRSPWMILLTVGCVATVFAAIVWRLFSRAPRLPIATRLAGAVALVALTSAVAGFAAAGPLQNGWARSAGTPPRLLASSAAAGTTGELARNLSDDVTGTVVQGTGGGVELDLRDARDAAMRLTIVLDATQSSGALAVSEGSAAVCTGTVQVAADFRGSCGGAGVVLTLTQLASGSVTGHLTTS